MSQLGDLVQKVRSKNAGPFWLTIDIFCGSEAVFESVCDHLDTGKVAARLGADAGTLKRFDITALNVIKISLPRPSVQGAIDDRDMHGASWASLIAEMDI